MLKTVGSHVRGNVVGYIALFIALGGSAYGATGGNFILGQSNTAGNTTSLSAPISGKKALQVTNTSTGAGATALGLNVASGHPPFTVNSATKVANLNADKLDGVDSTGFLPSSSVQRLVYTAPAAADPAPITPIATIGPFTIKGQCQLLSAFHAEVRLYVRMGPPSGTADSMWSETQDDTTDRGTKSTGLLIPTDTDLRIVQVESGELAYARGAGTSMLKEYGSGLVQVDFHAVADSRSGGTASSCFIYGTATRVT
jgi:hypothetical protein